MSSDPTITVVAIAYNEERMMPFFLNHYSKFVEHIVIYDNFSTDKTEKICNDFKQCKVSVVKYNSDNYLNDGIYLEIKNNVYKNYDTDYCIIVDSDEFLYHKNLKEFLLKNKDVSVFRATGFNMVSEYFPEGDDILQIKTGVRDKFYNKSVLLKIKDISRIQGEAGFHSGQFFNIEGQTVEPFQSEDLKLLHYKNISFEYRLNRHLLFKDRMSEFNKMTGFGEHYMWSRERQLNEFNLLLSQASNII